MNLDGVVAETWKGGGRACLEVQEVGPRASQRETLRIGTGVLPEAALIMMSRRILIEPVHAGA